MECNHQNVNYTEHGFRSGNHTDESQSTSNQETLNIPMVGAFLSIYTHTSVSRNVLQTACNILKDLISEEVFETTKIADASIFAAVIYMALIETRLPYGPSDPHLVQRSLEPPSMTVTDVLTLADININQLFKTLEVTQDKYEMSRTIQNHLQQMKRNYCVVSALFHAFESRLCPTIFTDENKSDNPDYLPPMPETEGVAFRKKQCWLLFLLAKYHLLPDQHDLCQHFQLLLCCLEFVLRQTPSFLLNAPYVDIRVGCNAQEDGDPMIERFAKDFEVSVKETLELHKSSTESYFQTLLNRHGELDSELLTNEYLKTYGKEGDINELLFLEKDSHLSPTQSSRVTNHTAVQSQLLPNQMTPVRTATSTVQHLEKSFEYLPNAPSQYLQAYFQKCSQNPADNLQQNICNLRGNFVEKYQRLNSTPVQSTVAEHRFDLGLKIFYRVLETMLNAESDRLPQQVLTSLLNTRSFHSALLACAMEVVLTTYGQCWDQAHGVLSSEATPYTFPWILGVFSLQACDFYKVIDSFIRFEPKLSRDIVKHLQNVEFKILACLAWKEGSSIFDALGHWDMGQTTPPQMPSPCKPSDFSGDSPHGSNNVTRSAVDLFLSPVRPSRQSSGIGISMPSTSTSLPLALPASPAKQSSLNSVINTNGCKIPSPPRSRSLSHFLDKVCKLGYCRLTKLCNSLEVARDIQQKIWTCYEHCVKRLPTLIKNRHIDQIFMCCIYGICKVTDREIRFKDIVNKYRELPHAEQEVYKDVYITADRSDSIINFYNSIFMQNLKSFILQFAPNSGVRAEVSPTPKQPAASPSYYIAGKKNFTVTQLTDSPFKAPASPSQMTPSTKLLYSFGDTLGSSEKFRGFNERVNARRFGAESARKRLNMDDVPGPSVSKARKVLL